MHTTVVFAGGPHPSPPHLSLPGPPPDLVVAADSGLHVALLAGIPVDLVVGDLDSVDPVQLDRAVRSGTTVDRHPVDKDATDLELALEAALDAGTDRVVVVASASGRMDHLLGALSVLASPRWAGFEIEARFGAALIVPVHGRRSVAGRPGALVSLLAVGGPAVGVTTSGLKWVLEGETLEPGSSRGMSNRFVTATAEVSVQRGCVVVVVPEEES